MSGVVDVCKVEVVQSCVRLSDIKVQIYTKGNYKGDRFH